MDSNEAAKHILAYLDNNKNVKADKLIGLLKISKAAVYRHLNNLINQGKVIRSGESYRLNLIVTTGSAQNLNKSSDPPLVDIKVTNPITYLKSWWAKVMGKEGIALKLDLHVRPLTALGIAFLIIGFGLGLGKIITSNAVKNAPMVGQYLVEPSRTA